ncbi:MAG: segregation/condensation protein A [Phycisphaerae bacterium]|nr:segregation/condensation protein A [Phycisphaerae bacterium]
MTDYRVDIDVYNGPMDLLLYLIRRDEIDIYNLPIARITGQYLKYIEMLQQVNIDLAGEFLVMAATLMEVKSAILLPRDEVETPETEDLGDPRLELVRQLLEYKKFKDAAGDLTESASEQASRYNRPLSDLQRLRHELKQEQELDMESVQIWDLFDVFNRLMKATLANNRKHEVIQDVTPIDVYECYILERAQKENPLKFEAIFVGIKNRGEMIGMFLAVLELIRQKLVIIEQEKAFGIIYIFAQTDTPAKLAVAHAISATIEELPSIDMKEKEAHLTQMPVKKKTKMDIWAVHEEEAVEDVKVDQADVGPSFSGHENASDHEPAVEAE